MTRQAFLLLIVLLGMLTALAPLSVDPILPSLPAIAESLATDTATAQLNLSALMVGLALGQLIYGPMSDRFGRKPVVLAGLAVYIGAAIGCANADSIETLIAFRLVQGFAACAGHILPRAIVRDRFDREDAARLLSYILVVHGVAPLVGPILGAYLGVTFGWHSVFWFNVAFGVTLLVLLWTFLRESIAARDPDALRLGRLAGNYRMIFRHPVFLGYTMCAGYAYGGLLAFLTASPAVIIVHLGESAENYAYYYATTMLGYMVGNWTGARLVRRLGIDRLVIAGAVLMALAGMAMAVPAWLGVDAIAVIVASMFCFMFAFSLVVPQSQAAALSPFPHIAGTASSLMGFIQLGIAALTGFLVSLLDDGTQLPMATAIAIVGLGPLATVWLVLGRGRAARET